MGNLYAATPGQSPGVARIYIYIYVYTYMHTYIYIYIYMSIHYSTYMYFASFLNGYILCRFVTSIWLLIVGSSTIYLLEILPSTPYFSAEMAPHKQSEQATVQVLLHGPLCEVFKTDPGGPVSDRPLCCCHGGTINCIILLQ